jgi:hypothetical protein
VADPVRKPWWKSKKVWGVIFGVLIRLFGAKLGIDPASADAAATIALAGVGAEAVVDAADAVGRGLKREDYKP